MISLNHLAAEIANYLARKNFYGSLMCQETIRAKLPFLSCETSSYHYNDHIERQHNLIKKLSHKWKWENSIIILCSFTTCTEVHGFLDFWGKRNNEHVLCSHHGKAVPGHYLGIWPAGSKACPAKTPLRSQEVYNEAQEVSDFWLFWVLKMQMNDLCHVG